MKYKVITSQRAPTSASAMFALERQVQEVLKAGGQLVGGVSVIHILLKQDQSFFEAFQAVLMPPG
ncbi:hypothetical protein QU487_06415 [Crenobacter sp. SG2305]|uniref:hypothetical protein n=1 Tax=Crenobacter oryzisoli TaxID=3056844 RepID=UPI0025AAAE1F|nr:hypothetical protein [Crenobacter sp. SG2305]MDN0082386.1 hypothetical protein [Crenobacter sp. SG2305]